MFILSWISKRFTRFCGLTFSGTILVLYPIKNKISLVIGSTAKGLYIPTFEQDFENFQDGQNLDDVCLKGIGG